MRDGGGDGGPLRWKVFGERTLYDQNRTSFGLTEVETPSGRRFEHPVTRYPTVAVGLVLDERERVLLYRRHRFVVDAAGWELPSGVVEPEEHAAVTAVRAVEEATGWRPASPMVHLMTFQPMVRAVAAQHELFLAEGATPVGDRSTEYCAGTDGECVEWVPLAAGPGRIAAGDVRDGGSLIGLLYLLALRAKRA